MKDKILIYRGKSLETGELISGKSRIWRWRNQGEEEHLFIRPLSEDLDTLLPFAEVVPTSFVCFWAPFSPSKETIREKLAKAYEEAEKLGVTLDVSEDDFIDDEHLDCVWYGGDIGTLTYKGFEISIEVHGEVRLSGEENDPIYSGFEYVDKANDGAYGAGDDSLRTVFASDRELHDAKDRLYYGDNNWVEFFVKDPAGELHDGDVIDDNVLDAFQDISYWVDMLEKNYISKAS